MLSLIGTDPAKVRLATPRFIRRFLIYALTHGQRRAQAAAGSPPKMAQNSSRALLRGKSPAGTGTSRKSAKRLPAVRRREDQQPVRRDRRPHLFVVAPVGSERAFLVEAAKHPFEDERVHGVEDCGDRGRQGQVLAMGKEFADGAGIAGPPVLFRPFGVDDLGIGECDAQLMPERCTGKVDLRGIAVEHLRPIDLFTRLQCRPMRRLSGIFHDFDHVVAGAEPELLKCHFRRHRACPAKPGADDFQSHA